VHGCSPHGAASAGRSVAILPAVPVREHEPSLGHVQGPGTARALVPGPLGVSRRSDRRLLHAPKFLSHVLATLYSWAVGLGVATLISVPIGILIGTSELAYKMSSPVIEFMRPLPSVALIPLGILLWGQGFSMKVILVAYAATWPILFNAVYGVHD